MAWRVAYHPDVPKDVAAIPANVRDRIRRAIETRLMTRPEQYGERLRKDLAGAWKLRVGDYRIVFDLEPKDEVVTILIIAHRRSVHGRVAGRRRRPPR